VELGEVETLAAKVHVKAVKDLGAVEGASSAGGEAAHIEEIPEPAMGVLDAPLGVENVAHVGPNVVGKGDGHGETGLSGGLGYVHEGTPSATPLC